jgi:hypothetical protein
LCSRFFAIQLADYLYNLQSTKSKYAVQRVQSVVIVLLLVIIAVLQYFFKPSELAWPVIVLIIALLVLLMSIPKHLNITGIRKTVIRSVIAAFVVNLYLNMVFYPSLLHYQGGSEAAFYINKQNTNNYPVAIASEYNFPLDFYIRGRLITIDQGGAGPIPQKPFYLFGNPAVIKSLADKGWHMEPVKSFDNYWISMLKPKFLNSKTRREALDTVQVVLVR